MSVALFGCPQKKKDTNSDPGALSDLIVGTWKQELSVCGGSTYQTTDMVNKLVLAADRSFTFVSEGAGCVATRTGTYGLLAVELTLSQSAVTCSTNPCEATYQVNSESRTLKCPSGVANNQMIFKTSADASTLYLTPTTGSDAVCYYKYIKQ